jgi:hypothetical protein
MATRQADQPEDGPAEPRAWFEPSQAAGTPAQDAPSGAPAYGHRTPTGEFGASTAAPADGLTVDTDSEELPRRVRQANLVPQLRKEPASQPLPAPVADSSEDDERRAEESRDLMTSLQSGWTLGRGSDEGDDGIPFERRNEWGES